MSNTIESKTSIWTIITCVVSVTYMVATVLIFLNNRNTLKFYKDLSVITNRPIILPTNSDILVDLNKKNPIIEIPFTNKGSIPAFDVTIVLIPTFDKILSNHNVKISAVRASCAPEDNLLIKKPLNAEPADEIPFDNSIEQIILKDGTKISDKMYVHLFSYYTSTSIQNGFRPPYYCYMATYELQFKSRRLLLIGAKEVILEEPISNGTYVIYYNPPSDYRFSKNKFSVITKVSQN